VEEQQARWENEDWEEKVYWGNGRVHGNGKVFWWLKEK
jgi:hypothetical protein